MRKFTFTLGVLGVLSGCATGYHSKGLTGGLAETQLSEHVYQVRFQGNGYTSQDRTAVYLLRRCAELTLEHGFRYFSLGAQGTGSMESGASGWIFSFPHGMATVKFLEIEADDPTPLDAVIVVKDTDERAGGKLSVRAQAQLSNFTSGTAGPNAGLIGSKLVLTSGESFGTVLLVADKHVFQDGAAVEGFLVGLTAGGETWIRGDQARKMLAVSAPAAPAPKS